MHNISTRVYDEGRSTASSGRFLRALRRSPRYAVARLLEKSLSRATQQPRAHGALFRVQICVGLIQDLFRYEVRLKANMETTGRGTAHNSFKHGAV